MANGQDLKVSTDMELTGLEKEWWPGEGITKADVMSYYNEIAPVILPYLKDRPLSLHRFSEGIGQEGSYLKNMNRGVIPLWVHTELLYDASGKETISYLVCDDRPTLLYIINLGCISLDPWHSRAGTPDHPDWAVISLVSDGPPFGELVETACVIHDICGQAEIDCYCKTAGRTGLHLYIPLGARYPYEEARELARRIVQLAQARQPGITTTEKATEKRKGKIYLDISLNDREQVAGAPYSILPEPGAPVSMPLEWAEVKPSLDPLAFHVYNAAARVKEKGDLWRPVAGKGISMGPAIEKLERLKEEQNK